MKMRNLTITDVALIKWSVTAATLALVAASTPFTNYIRTVSPLYLIAIAIGFGVRPLYRFYFKK